jgi:hypothetical protein
MKWVKFKDVCATFGDEVYFKSNKRNIYTYGKVMRSDNNTAFLLTELDKILITNEDEWLLENDEELANTKNLLQICKDRVANLEDELKDLKEELIRFKFQEDGFYLVLKGIEQQVMKIGEVPNPIDYAALGLDIDRLTKYICNLEYIGGDEILPDDIFLGSNSGMTTREFAKHILEFLVKTS